MYSQGLQVGSRFHLTIGDMHYFCAVEGEQFTGPPEMLPMKYFSQNDPRWKQDTLLDSAHTIGSAGCALTCAAMVISQVDPAITPGILNKMLDNSSGSGLLSWERVAKLFPGILYEGPSDRGPDGPLVWRHGEADMERVKLEMSFGPVIMQIDYKPGGALNSHFVIALSRTSPGGMVIVDPIDGQRVGLLERYGLPGWNLARCIYGLRLLRKFVP